MAYSPARKDFPQLYTSAQVVQSWASIPVMTLIGFAVIFSAAFFNMVDFNAGKEVVALDKQVAIKLLICTACALYGGFGILTDPRVRKLLFSFPGVWMVIILGFYALSVLTSLDVEYSLASTICLAAIIVSVPTALVQLGVMPVLNTVFWACGLFILASWATFFLVPHIGVFSEPLEDGQFFERMGGLAHPNTLGQFAGITIVLGVVMHVSFGMRSGLRNMVILLAIGALIMSISRAAGGATVLALLIAYRDKLLRREFVTKYLFIGTFAMIGLMFLSLGSDLGQLFEGKLLALSKSGDSTELTTITGRSEIWAYAIGLIGERPITGWGAATSKYLLADYSHYTHNLVLNVALSTGVFGGLAALMMCGSRLFQMLKHRHPMCDAMVAFICITGLVENVIFSPIAAMPTIAWIIALVWWNLENAPAVTSPTREAQYA